MRAHIIKDGKVVNTIVVDSLDFLPGLIDASLGGAIGDLWDGQIFTTPPKTPEQLAEEARQAAAQVAKQEIFSAAIIKLTYAELDAYINANVTDLIKAREYLKKLSRVVKALVERGYA